MYCNSFSSSSRNQSPFFNSCCKSSAITFRISLLFDFAHLIAIAQWIYGRASQWKIINNYLAQSSIYLNIYLLGLMGLSKLDDLFSTHPLYGHGMCKWPSCDQACDDFKSFIKYARELILILLNEFTLIK